MEKQPDHRTRRSPETLNRIIAPLAGRPQGVTAKELMADAAMDHERAYSCLHLRLKSGMLVCRRGTEGGGVVTRFWTDAALAEVHQFEAAPRSTLWDSIIANLGPAGLITQDLAELLKIPASPLAQDCLKMFKKGMIGRAADLSAYGRPVFRYFRTQDEADAWQRLPGNSVTEKIRLRDLATAERRRERRAVPPKPKPIRSLKPAKLPKPPKEPAPPKAPRVVQPKAAAPAKASLPKAARVREPKVIATPPALQPGQPIITEQTKITRISTPLGRYEVEGSRVIGGFGSGRIGHYDRPASNWAQAVAEAA
ncbi:hypothetical protein SAMN05216359_105296 [Roseateles sp. YR242]|uniref:hypothetical protein n=1 Tax=Roseateles sp. YR242 TaxID=1855305 RepID=UPI0008ADC480|nr:hypothetical protein [Roseateles sp. YR242]SEL12801.1 hypothetical protein SAMN05216359_105296 [Roseateles sp. YR242]